MNKYLHYRLFLLVLTSLLLPSCTLEEPENNSGVPSADALLQSITCHGRTVIYFDYDRENRIIRIITEDDEEFLLAYDGASREPSSIVIDQYDYAYEYSPSKDDEIEHRYLRYHEVMTDIHYNADGHISNCKVERTTTDLYWEKIYENGNWVLKKNERQDVTNWTTSYEYDNHDHLISIRESDGETFCLTWENGLLLSFASDYVYKSFSYSATRNASLTWDPIHCPLGPLAITGIYGKAPEKFLKEYDYIQIAYSLFDNGLIHMAKSYEDSTFFIYQFDYQKK